MIFCVVSAILKAIFMFVFLNMLVTALIFGLWNVNVAQISFSFLSVCGLVFCCIRLLSFLSSCVGTLLFFPILWMVCHSFRFLLSSSGSACILSM